MTFIKNDLSDVGWKVGFKGEGSITLISAWLLFTEVDI